MCVIAQLKKKKKRPGMSEPIERNLTTLAETLDNELIHA